MDFENYLRFALALVFVLVLIVLVGWIFRRLGFGTAAPTTARHRRLGVVEVLSLDAKRRLVLVRRDDVEHLLLLGATADHVVEGGIRRGFGETIRAVEAEADSAGPNRTGSPVTPYIGPPGTGEPPR